MKAYLLIIYLMNPSGLTEEVESKIFLSREDCTEAAYSLFTESPFLAVCSPVDFATQVKTVGMES